MTTNRRLRRVSAQDVRRNLIDAIDPEASRDAADAMDRVRAEGETAIRSFAESFGERASGEPLRLDRAEMERALGSVSAGQRAVLERAADRVRAFARAQLDAIGEVCVPIPGGEAGHTIEPIEAAGCYAPGGRYPLPSSALMTAIPARVAGCRRVVVASPGAQPLVVAAAAIAGADEFLAVGGAHAIAALTFGFGGFEPVDFIAGPGNRWVTAAKHLASRHVGIDMLAGPSELLVIADDSADPALIAADLLAQAEHDDDARPLLVTTSARLADDVDDELEQRLARLASRQTAERALRNGFVCVVEDMAGAVEMADALAAEHVEVHTRDAESVAGQISHAGAVFVGPGAAEVLGDYGAGPNHTLPTGGTARHCAGLSVASFLRLRTWIRIDDMPGAKALLADAEALAELESLPGHAASACLRAPRDCSSIGARPTR